MVSTPDKFCVTMPTIHAKKFSKVCGSGFKKKSG